MRWSYAWPFALTAVAVLCLSAALGRMLYLSRFAQSSNASFAYCNEQLSAARGALSALAGMPAMEQLTAGRGGSVTGRPEAELAESWDRLSASDARLMPILQNGVAEILRLFVERHPWIDRCYLTDERGFVVAASEKPDAFAHAGDELFVLARSFNRFQVAGESIRPDGTVRLAARVIRSTSPPRGLGVLVAEGVLPPPVSDDVSETAGLYIGLADPYVIRAGEGIDPEAVGQLVEHLMETGPETARMQGYDYRARVLDGGIHWLRPQWMIHAQPRVWLPLEAVYTIGALAAVFALLYILWYFTLLRGPARSIFQPASLLARAGHWVLERATPNWDDRPTAENNLLNKKGESEQLLMLDRLEAWYREFGKNLEEHILAQSQEMQRDLELARDFQQAFLNRPYPAIPTVHTPGRIRLEFYHQYHPALALGGDFFDIIRLGPNSAGILLADVMGHGTRSALITSMIRTISGDLAAQGRHATHYLQEMNRQFTDMLKIMPQPLFASAFFFVADTTARMATYASAGHPAPFHIHRHMGRISRLEVPPPRGAALGLIADETYTGGHCRLVPGDSIIFFTDGLYEAHNEHHEEFGLQRVEKVLKDNMYHRLDEMVNALKQAVLDFTGKDVMDDDICIIGMHVTTRAEDGVMG